MSHLNPGLISAYNSLTDKHLAGYFSNTRIRRHLQRAGLITRSGRIVPDKEYRHKLIQRYHQRHVRECLAQAIFHKVLEMERVHQIEIKRRLEEFARRERVHKIKVERSKRYEEDIARILSPHPPTGARGICKQHSGPEGEHSESSESPGSSRPNTAPGKMQRPVRLKPIHSNSTTASLRRSSPYRLLESSNENDQPFNCTVESRRRLTRMEASHGISPYCLPVINNFVTPVPPATKRKERGVKVNPSCTLRGRRLRPTTSFSGADVNEDPPMLRSSVHQSRVSVNMMYFGKTVHLSNDLNSMRDEVKVFQQHCGGENLCVYKGMLREGETFRFISRRHRGFPFSLTFFLNGLQVERLSSCCEFKHRKGSRLGGRNGHFGFSSIEGASPCYKCIIAMGLDKKPTPPPKRVKGDGAREESGISPKDSPEMKTEVTGEDDASHSECESNQPQDMETQVKEETAAEEDKVRDDYEEDFEADDEGPAEDAEAKEKKSPSPFTETEGQVKERDAFETEDDENDEETKSRSSSSSSGSDQEESDAEADKESREDEKAGQPKEADQEETVVPPHETDEPNPEEATEAESAVAKDSDIQNSAGDSTEIDISDSSVPSGNENKQSDDTSGDNEVEKMVVESKQEEEQERAKSVQEKLAEAILKEPQCSSEPELSDTSTEEEEESAHKGPEQGDNEAVSEKSITEQQQNPIEETTCEEGVVHEDKVMVQDEEETCDPGEQEDETEQKLHQNSDGYEDERVRIDEKDEKAASEENTEDSNKSEDTEDTSLHPVCEEKTHDKNSEPQEDAATKSAAAAGKDEEKTAVEADTQPDETGLEAKSNEEDESSVSEPNKEADETAVPDNAEAMTASETMEMKAEPSEEREALNCEEAPVTDTVERQQGDSDDRAAASETEVTAENSSSSLEGSGDTTVEQKAETSGDNANDEDDIKKEEAEEVSAGEARKENQQERCDLGEEETEQSVEIDDKVEEKSEEEAKEQEKQTNPDEITEGDKSEERKVEDNETKTEKRVEYEENISELTKSESNTEGNANEQVEKPHGEDDKVTIEGKADESEKTEKDEGGKCVMNENDEEKRGAATDKTNEGEKISAANTAADGEKNDEAEKEERDQNENKAEQSEDDEKKGVTDEAAEGEEMSESAEEPEKSADADVSDNVKISDGNIVESEDVSDSDAANVARETVMTGEMPNDMMEAADDEKKESERGEIDVENGEISSRAENKTREDEAQSEGKNDVKTAEHTEDEIKTEEPAGDESTEVKESTEESGDGAEKRKNDEVDQAPDTDVVESEVKEGDEIKTEEPAGDESMEVKELTEESGDGAEKHVDDEADQAPDTDVVESEVKEGDESVEKQEESTNNNSELEKPGTEIKEEFPSDDRKDGEEMKQDENCNLSEPDHEKRDSDLIRKNEDVQNNVIEVKVASSGEQVQSSTPIPVDLDDTAHKLDGSTEPYKADKHPHTDAAAIDLSAVMGENGDTEEASKASEEGASVVLKPQAQSSSFTQKEESVAVGKETPEALATEDNIDLVSNWVTMHQASKFFETFVEPLDDLKETDARVTHFAQSTDPPRLVSPLNTSENAEQEQTAKDVNESRDNNKEEATESELESNHSKRGEPCEEDPVKDILQVQEETEVTDLIPEAESEQSAKESDVRSGEHDGRRGSLEEDKGQEGLMQDNAEQTDISKTEVESIAGAHHSVTSGRPESVSENQTEQKTTDNSPDMNEKQTTVEELKDLLPSSETEERHERSASPDGLSKLKTNELKDTEEMWEKSGEVTEVTDFTEDRNEEESHHNETRPKPSDESVNGDGRDVRLIQDTQHTLSKDRLSPFSVDETLFGPSSYPLLTAARTESGH